MRDEEKQVLDVLGGQIDEGNIDPEALQDQLRSIHDHLGEITDEVSHSNMVYAQKGVLERAERLLIEFYVESDEYGDREAEALAVAMTLAIEYTDGEVW